MYNISKELLSGFLLTIIDKNKHFANGEQAKGKKAGLKRLQNLDWKKIFSQPSTYIWAMLIAVAFWIVKMAIWANDSPFWTGFGAYDETVPRAKTLWDWMELMIIPVTLALGAYLLDREQTRRAEWIAEEKRQQDLLDAYFDKITELTLNHGLGKANSDVAVRSIARTRTISVINMLDEGRGARILQFLSESELITGEKPIVILRGVTFRNCVLSGATLVKRNLVGVTFIDCQFQDANFRDAILTGCIFLRGDLTGARFDGAKLVQAKLNDCNLSEVIFNNADLEQSNLLGSTALDILKLKSAEKTHDLILPNGELYDDEYKS